MTTPIKLIDFLKKYTAISHKFIKEYYKFYEISEYHSFGIKLEDVLDYLEISDRINFYDRFRKKYKIELDYKIIRLKQKEMKGVKSAIYYISLDTFEKICMVSKSEKANSVRDYFIILRKFINYYKDHISEMILEKANKNPSKCIYILLVNKNKNIFKYGRTNDLRKRLKNYATGKDKHPDIKFIMLVDNPNDIEDCAKVFLNKYAYKKGQEIYKIDFDFIKTITNNCVEMIKHLDFIKDNKDNDAYIIFDDYESLEYLDTNGKTIGYEKNTKDIGTVNVIFESDEKKIKKLSKKKTSKKKTSKKISKKLSKKTSKKLSKKTSKK
jgi:phage anti-repressor protein